MAGDLRCPIKPCPSWRLRFSSRLKQPVLRRLSNAVGPRGGRVPRVAEPVAITSGAGVDSNGGRPSHAHLRRREPGGARAEGISHRAPHHRGAVTCSESTSSAARASLIYLMFTASNRSRAPCCRRRPFARRRASWNDPPYALLIQRLIVVLYATSPRQLPENGNDRPLY